MIGVARADPDRAYVRERIAASHFTVEHAICINSVTGLSLLEHMAHKIGAWQISPNG
jgi:hypothetical protein